MKFNKIAFGVLVALITVQGVHAARFTVYNKSSAHARFNPRWKGRADTFDVIQAGSSRTYDSGLQYVTGIKWEGISNGSLNLNVDPLNLGGTVEILDTGVTWNFGIAGKGTLATSVFSITASNKTYNN